MQLACPKCGARDARVAHRKGLGEWLGALDWHLSAALPALRNALANQHLAIRCLEVRALPQMLPPGTFHLERRTLQSAALDRDSTPLGRHAVSLRGLPL